jgi:hypothetical protein
VENLRSGLLPWLGGFEGLFLSARFIKPFGDFLPRRRLDFLGLI